MSPLMDADSQLDMKVRRSTLAILGDPRLKVTGAAQCIDTTGEFCEKTVARRLDHPTVVGSDIRIDRFTPESPQAR